MATSKTPKEYIDKTTKAHIKQEEKVKRDIQEAKEKRRLTRETFEREFGEIQNEINEKYPSGKVEEEFLINQRATKIYPLQCKCCTSVKIFPYDFITKQNTTNGNDKCSTCMMINSSKSREIQVKNQVRCQCGLLYYGSNEGHFNHIISKSHLNNMEKLVKGVKYTEAQMFQLCRLNHIGYYKAMNQKKMAQALNALGENLKTDI